MGQRIHSDDNVNSECSQNQASPVANNEVEYP